MTLPKAGIWLLSMGVLHIEEHRNPAGLPAKWKLQHYKFLGKHIKEQHLTNYFWCFHVYCESFECKKFVLRPATIWIALALHSWPQVCSPKLICIHNVFMRWFMNGWRDDGGGDNDYFMHPLMEIEKLSEWTQRCPLMPTAFGVARSRAHEEVFTCSTEGIYLE